MSDAVDSVPTDHRRLRLDHWRDAPALLQSRATADQIRVAVDLGKDLETCG